MIATIIGLIVAFWLVALLIAAVADHPWLLLLPLLAVLGIAVIAFSGDRPSRPASVEQAVTQDSPEAQRERAQQYVIASAAALALNTHDHIVLLPHDYIVLLSVLGAIVLVIGTVAWMPAIRRRLP